jgi:hypothetical protein
VVAYDPVGEVVVDAVVTHLRFFGISGLGQNSPPNIADCFALIDGQPTLVHSGCCW